MDTKGFSPHDHDSCISDGVSAARVYCEKNRLQLTKARARVLEILLMQHRAMGAYEILDILREDGIGSQPPVVYRALDFLTQHGFVHKIERLNAFIACANPGEDHDPAFLICRSCDSVAEAHADLTEGRLGDAAKAAGFEIERKVVEAEGLCPNCTEQETK
jgi:Fur family zinc uptake transcriptional regulator